MKLAFKVAQSNEKRKSRALSRACGITGHRVVRIGNKRELGGGHQSWQAVDTPAVTQSVFYPLSIESNYALLF
jgi:hypothetical protein